MQWRLSFPFSHLQASGIEGTFRLTCEGVMNVLRENKESLMAVLEAFVYDPVINWRLLTQTNPEGDEDALPEIINNRAVEVIDRVSKKLTGTDFGKDTLSIPDQVQRLIEQATSHENLCACWVGWCPFW